MLAPLLIAALLVCAGYLCLAEHFNIDEHRRRNRARAARNLNRMENEL